VRSCAGVDSLSVILCAAVAFACVEAGNRNTCERENLPSAFGRFGHLFKDPCD
jgi:hypothetical protein